MKWKQTIAVIAGVLIGLAILYGFAELDLGTGSVVADRTVEIGNNHTFNYDLDPGKYSIKIRSNEYIVIRFGGGVDEAMNTEGSVKTFDRKLIVSKPSVMDIHNPSEVLENSKATVEIKILRE